jgi:hypothetical protein
MDYSDLDKQALSLIEKINLKNLPKSDLLSFTSKLNEMTPELAKLFLSNYPELIKLIQNLMVEYKQILDRIIASDDDSTNQVYGILNKEIENSHESRKEFFGFANQIRSDLSKCLDNPNLTPKQHKEIIDREIEIFNMLDKKDTEIREKEIKIAYMADKKDSEKKAFNWELLRTLSPLIITAVSISATALGVKFEMKLPK